MIIYIPSLQVHKTDLELFISSLDYAWMMLANLYDMMFHWGGGSLGAIGQAFFGNLVTWDVMWNMKGKKQENI